MERYTTVQAAAALGVPATLIRQWHHHRRIHPIGYITDRGGTLPLYRLEELTPHADAYRHRARKRFLTRARPSD